MQNWVDFTSVKQSIALAPLLRHYHVKLRRSGIDQYRGSCPIHGGEGRDAFHTNLRKNVFHCFACGAGGTVLDFVAAMDRCSLRDAALKLAHAHTRIEPLEGCPTQLVTKKTKPLSPLGFTLRGINSAHPYLVKRGIEIATAERFGVGFYSGSGILSGRLVIPVHDGNGQLVAYCGRSVDATEPRYRFPSGFAKSELLFNLHRAIASGGSSSVVVVEGFFDCLKLHQAGVHSVVALMGSALYQTQQRALLQNFQRVVLMLDGDAAGRRATAASANMLRSHCTVEIIQLQQTMQPDQMSSDQIRYVLKPYRLTARIGQIQ